MTSQPKVVSVAVHYNTPADCINLVLSLLNIAYENHHIVIVDNCSDEILFAQLLEGLKRLPENPAKCEVIKNSSNVGFGGGVNFGFDYAIQNYNPNYLHVINTDAEVINNSYLVDLVKILENDKSIGIVGPAVLKENRREIQNTILPFVTLKTALSFKMDYKNLSFIEDQPTIKDVECVNGVCFLLPASVFKSVDGFDTNYFMYGEEQDLCYKIYLHGLRRVFWSGKSIIHYGADKEGSEIIDWRFIHVRKNQVAFLKKFDSSIKAIVLATLFSISLLVKLIRGTKLKQGETFRSVINQYYKCALPKFLIE